jgi:hypothetical protein
VFWVLVVDEFGWCGGARVVVEESGVVLAWSEVDLVVLSRLFPKRRNTDCGSLAEVGLTREVVEDGAGERAMRVEERWSVAEVPVGPLGPVVERFPARP